MATKITASLTRYPVTRGACREFWIKATGLVGLSAAAVVNVIENPYYEDLLIKEAIIYVTTVSGDVATNLDIGLANDSSGTGIGAELASGLMATILNVAGVKELGIVRSISAPPVQPIWRAKGYATDSFVATIQKGSVDASALRFNILLNCIPKDDLL